MAFPGAQTSFLDHEASYKCRCSNPGTGCAFMCCRSPRLLRNGYYVLTEDSFLSDEDGNVTLSLSQTSVTYKEKLIRIFRRRKRIRRSLGSLFDMSASASWLNSTTWSGIDAHFGEESWLERDNEMDASQCDNSGTADVSWGPKAQIEEKHNDPAPKTPPPSSKGIFVESRALKDSSPCTCLLASEYYQEKSLTSSKSCRVRKDICPMLMLSTGFIISLGARFFLGGILTTLLSCLLLFLLICKLST